MSVVDEIQRSASEVCENENVTPADIAARIFLESPYRAMRGLTCSFGDGVLTIDGNLPSFYMKQLAQKAVQGLDGVEHIENRAHVEV